MTVLHDGQLVSSSSINVHCTDIVTSDEEAICAEVDYEPIVPQEWYLWVVHIENNHETQGAVCGLLMPTGKCPFFTLHTFFLSHTVSAVFFIAVCVCVCVCVWLYV